jgi:large subunit ribosomal protein L33
MNKRRARGQQDASARVSVSLCCTVCQSRNYKTTKRSDKPLEIKKFCKNCTAHTVHVASK